MTMEAMDPSHTTIHGLKLLKSDFTTVVANESEDCVFDEFRRPKEGGSVCCLVTRSVD